MSDNILTGCWRLEQVGQHSSDEDDLFSGGFLNMVQGSVVFPGRGI